ncbi:hypothetical protein L4D09_21630 [Photobacterium makurazakiensis]|uniref:hypothetical protein n=1 Tax=Photobacterium makurazakiensis TaxID=2910234 RepID=UPI003D0FDE60
MCRLIFMFCSLLMGLNSNLIHAEVLPTSHTSLEPNKCRLDIYHLVKDDNYLFTPNLQLALITENNLHHRYVAMKADIKHPIGFENIGYYRSGSPVEIFTANWRNNGTKHTVTRLVMLGGTSDKQAFDVFLSLINQDKGHFELRNHDKTYRFNADNSDIIKFVDCINTHYN